MTSLDITLSGFELEGWPFTTWLGGIFGKIQEGNCDLFLKALKEFNPSAYRNARKRIIGALFKRYCDNTVNYLKEINYV